MILNGSSCIPAILFNCCVSDVADRERTNTAAAEIVHIHLQFFYNLIVWTWSSPRFHGPAAFVTSSWHLIRATQPRTIKSCNVTHSGLQAGLQLGRVLGLILPEWLGTWTGQAQPAEARLGLRYHFTTNSSWFKLVQLCSGNVGAALQWLCSGICTVALPEHTSW